MYEEIFTSQDINFANSQYSPSDIHARNTELQRYYARGLLQECMSTLSFGLPTTWSREYYLYTLFCSGNIAVLDTDTYGIIPQLASYRGRNIFYEPTTAIITNHALPEYIRERTIGVDCEIIRLQPDWGGVMDTVNFYADMLALCAENSSVNLIASKLAYVFRCGNKNTAETFKKMFDQISAGEPAVFLDAAMSRDTDGKMWDTFTSALKSNYIVADILRDMKTWRNAFLTEIGIPNSNTDKRERLVTDEVNSNNVETSARLDVWFDTLTESIGKVNAMFPSLNITVERRYPDGTTSEYIDNRSVL